MCNINFITSQLHKIRTMSHPQYHSANIEKLYVRCQLNGCPKRFITQIIGWYDRRLCRTLSEVSNNAPVYNIISSMFLIIILSYLVLLLDC